MACLSKEEVRSYISPLILLLVPLVVLFNFFQSIVNSSLTLWWAYRVWFPPPFIVVIVVGYLLRKKVRITPQMYAILFALFFLVANTFTYGVYMSGTYSTCQIPSWAQMIPVYMRHSDTFKEVWDMIPTYFAPSGEALDNLWNGGPIDWGAWMPSIIYWTFFLILYMVFETFWGYLLRKPLIEVEQLPFPGILPGVYLIQYATTEEEGKTWLFNFKNTGTKIFWVAFLIGFLMTFVDTLRYFIPAVPSSAYLGVHSVDLTPYTSKFLPGAFFTGNIRVTDILIWLFTPTDFLISIIIGWLIFGVLYPVIGVTSGILPYSPGVERSAGYYGLTHGPFKWMLFCTWGIGLGMGLWVLYNHRDHFTTIFRALYDKKLAAVEDSGLSYRFLSWGTVIISLLFMAFLIGNGVPVFVTLVFVILHILMLYGWTRLMGVSFEFMPTGQQFNWLRYDAGVIAGAWPAAPPAGNKTALVSFTLMTAAANTGQRISNLTMHHQFKIYKLGPATKTLGRDFFFITIATIISAAVITTPLVIWWYHTMGGLANLGPPGPPFYQWVSPEVFAWVKGTPTIPVFNPAERYGLLIGGALTAIVLYYLRTKFVWFFLDPLAFLILPTLPWVWITPIIAVILKYVILKIGGSRLFEEKATPFIVGYLVGYGVNAAIVAFLATFMIGLPKIL